MSSVPLPPPRQVTEGAKIAIVAARFNDHYVSGLIERCIDELERLDPECVIQLHRVPGSFEVPLGVERTLRGSRDLSAVIAFGLLHDGETGHALLVAQSVTGALQDLAIKHGTPVIHQILLVGDDEQAQARCFGDDLNRGVEADRAAIQMIQDLESIERSKATLPKNSGIPQNPLQRHHG